MKRPVVYLAALLSWMLLLGGCVSQAAGDGQGTIPFEEGQYYAVAHLGYQQMDSLAGYAQRYLDGEQVPVHYLSDGDYYLVIPRYGGMELALYQNDLETSRPVLIYEDPDCRPFVIQCNVSDIFADATIRLSREGEQVEFSPAISLKDGSVEVGEHGLDLTEPGGR